MTTAQDVTSLVPAASHQSGLTHLLDRSAAALERGAEKSAPVAKKARERSAELADFAVDSVGVVAGALIAQRTALGSLLSRIEAMRSRIA